MDLDLAILRLVGAAFGAATMVVLLPALLVAGVLFGAWTVGRWRRRWLLAFAVVTLAATVPAIDSLQATATTAVAVLRDDVGSVGAWRQLLLATSPASLAGGALTAIAALTWRSLRAPSWRTDRGTGRVVSGARRRRTRRRMMDIVLAGDEVLLGIDDDTGQAAGLPVKMLGRHTLVVGSTGSGKTTTATRLAMATLEQGGGLLVVDLKGDPDTITAWRAAAAARRRPCRVWSFDADAVYDPLAAGGVSERTRKVMALAEWTEPYYRDQAEQLLQLTLRTLDEVGERATLASLHAALTPAGLARLHQRAEGPASAELAIETASMTAGRLSALESVRTKLGLLTQAEFGPQLDPALTDGRPAIDLAASLNAGEVVVVSLDELSYGHIAARMAEVVLTDVAAVAGARLRERPSTTAMVWVDEFSAMRPGPLASLFARVRSAEIALVLSTQEVSDLVREDPTFRAAVATNVSTVLAHRVHDPDSAEWLASLIGTRSGWQETSQVEARNDWGEATAVGGATGLGTVREVEAYVVHPNRIKSLPDHHAYLARLDRPADAERARRVAVVPLAAPAPATAATPTAPALEPDRASPVRVPLQTEGYEKHREDIVDNEESNMTRVQSDLPGETW